jgi:non-heme chloroperoxidase
MTTALKSSAVTLASGLSLPYVETGDSSGQPVLLLHGYTDSWRSFEPVLPHFPQWIYAIVPTQRGHGEASKPATGYRPADFSSDVAAFMDAMALRSAVIVGHSMGSYVAQRFAIDYPERVAGLVLVGAFPTAKGNPAVNDLGHAVRDLQDPVPLDFAFEFQRSTVARPVPPELLATVTRESLKAPARVWRNALRALLEDDHSADLRRLTARTLIIWGDRDDFFGRADQDVLASAIRGARLQVYEGGGHSPHWEEPERFARDVAAFVQECCTKPVAA